MRLGPRADRVSRLPPVARSSVYATSPTAAGTTGPRGQRNRTSVNALSATDAVAINAVSAPFSLGSSAATNSTIVGHHMTASAPIRRPGRSAARIHRTVPSNNITSTEIPRTPVSDDDWRPARTSFHRRRSASRRCADTPDATRTVSPRTASGTVTWR